MDDWEVIRLRCVRDREPIKRVARELGIAPNTVRKYVRTLIVPQKLKVHRARRLDTWQTTIDEYLRSTPKITARRIGTLLRERHDTTLRIGERALREYVASRREQLIPKEAFVRAQYAPGDQSQFDFSPMHAIIGGTEQVVQVFAQRLSYSGYFFARASHRQDRPALFAGLLDAAHFFGGLTNVAIFDNAKTAVTKILRGRDRDENSEFCAFRGALALEVQFAAPRRGNEKGGVEGTMGYIEDNFFRPIPSFVSFDDLNAKLAHFCTTELQRTHATHRETIGERFAREGQTLHPLPTVLPKPCITDYARINKFAEVMVQTNRYSVPTRFAYRDAIVEIYDQRVVIIVDGEAIAQHQRANGTGQAGIDPLHCIDLISHKHRSATRALAFAEERLPQVLIRLRDRLIEEQGPGATKTWMAVLRLALESSLEALAQATEIALSRGTLDPQAIALLLRQRADAPARIVFKTPAPAQTAQIVDLTDYRIATLVECAS